jgi:hypothetical protein
MKETINKKKHEKLSLEFAVPSYWKYWRYLPRHVPVTTARAFALE